MGLTMKTALAEGGTLARPLLFGRAGIALLCAAYVMCFASASAAPSAAVKDMNTKVNKDFTACLIAEARKHPDYTSSDGGHSAMKLLLPCDASWTAWVSNCQATGGGSDGDCTVKSGALAQLALLALGQ